MQTDCIFLPLWTNIETYLQKYECCPLTKAQWLKLVIQYLKYNFIIMPLLNILAALLLKIAVNIVMFCTYCFYNFIRKPQDDVQKCMNATTTLCCIINTRIF